MRKEYGLPTAIAMIVGIVIGSGIFFKSDDILRYTGGSVALGALIFILAAISIIFGSLSISELAARNSSSGGIVSYAAEFSKPIACAMGWFQLFLYYPTLTAVVAWVAGIYTCILFNIEMTLLTQVGLGTIYMIILFAINIISKVIGGYIQNISTIIKLIPLIFIAFCGLAFGNPTQTLTATQSTTVGYASILGALAPIAFSFDGWIVTTSIGGEIRNSKRNLPIALIVSPILILIVYLIYFIGISSLMDPMEIIELGDAHVDVVANNLLGAMGAKVLLTFVVISVLGTVNGLILGGIRMPQSLAEKNMFPQASYVKQVNEKLGISVPAAIIYFVITIIWMFLHYITQQYDLLNGSDISEISVAISYALYIYLYVQVIILAKKGEIQNSIKGYLIPILAIIGALIILSSVFSNPLFIVHLTICVVVCISAIVFFNNNAKKD
ncbi:MAG: amino acid permease [Epulopiscium sp. Nuni2H_MBin003]|nr:MAG: amino acid permease [Epulopiscium sp. Nuni2H_MBin003]